MKTILLLPVVIIIFCIQALGQTTVESGIVSGTWDVSGSPYLIEGEINIPIGSTLIIDPGVTVNFQGHYKFIIYGQIEAEGTELDSIIFTTDDPVTGWHGLRFLATETNFQSPSIVSYCRIEYGKTFGSCPDNQGAGIYIDHSDPTISYNTIRRNTAVSGISDWGGGGIFAEYATAIISHNVITENYSGNDGGGIYLSWTSGEISDNLIFDNEAVNRGGGIANFLYSSPDILNNTIIENSANSKGGGIYQSGGNSLIEYNFITDNYASSGGGIYCFTSSSRIWNNVIDNNTAANGGALYNEGCSPTLFCNTIADNEASINGGALYNTLYFVGIAVYSNPNLKNTILYGNSASSGSQIYSTTGSSPYIYYSDIQDLTLGGIYGTYVTGDGCLDVLPGFVGTGDHPYALNESSLCIDVGSSDLGGYIIPVDDIIGNDRELDGDGNGSIVIDIGAYEYTGLSSGYFLEISVILEGPYNGMDMNIDLKNLQMIPSDQPYDEVPWSYTGDESVEPIPSNVVDWIFVELYDAVDAASISEANKFDEQAGFLKNDGSLVSFNGTDLIQFSHEIVNDLYVVVIHRNHLDVLSDNPFSLVDDTYSYDFTSASTQAYGTDAQKSLGGGKYGMISADANADGNIDEDDAIESWYLETGESGYLGSDVNLNGQSNNQDKNEFWLNNTIYSSQVPE